MAWALPEDIKSLWHSPKVLPADSKLVNFISTVESQIRRAYGNNVQLWIEANLLELEFVKQTIAWIVIEYLQTDGKPFASESQSYAGAASASRSLTDTARTSLRLTATDLEMFQPVSAADEGSFFVASMAPGVPHFPTSNPYYDSTWIFESRPGEADGWYR
jgi:hypothetical protein